MNRGAAQSSQISANAPPHVGGAAWAFICRCSRRLPGWRAAAGFFAGGWEEPEPAWQWREDPRRNRQSGDTVAGCTGASCSLYVPAALGSPGVPSHSIHRGRHDGQHADPAEVGREKNPRTRVGKGQSEPHDPVHADNYAGNKGLGISHIVYCNVRGKILRIETVAGAMNDKGAHLTSRVFTNPQEFLSDGEVGVGDGACGGLARADSDDLYMCLHYRRHPRGDLSNAERPFNTEQRRFRVVVENTIVQIKKWKVVGNGKAFRQRRDFETDVFNVCARLTARIVRVRDKYPRSREWIGKVSET
ncbi:unnamed protein product [Ectocarpus sp. 4 AP-2014]